jgi:hypothetical protein
VFDVSSEENLRINPRDSESTVKNQAVFVSVDEIGAVQPSCERAMDEEFDAVVGFVPTWNEIASVRD